MTMTRKWTIHLFAGLADRFGQPAISLDLEQAELSVSELKQALADAYPIHEPLINVSFLACNQAYAADSSIITFMMSWLCCLLYPAARKATPARKTQIPSNQPLHGHNRAIVR